MCARYKISNTALNALLQMFSLEPVPFSETRLAFQPPKPRFNVAPTQLVPAVRRGDRDGQRELVTMQWGLVPSWAKDVKIGRSGVNAKAETVAEKPMFRAAYKRRRCLIPADGYYEWETVGKAKLPWLYEVQGGTFAFAGLWESWRDLGNAEAQPLETCTILTTEPNELAAVYHDRMPVILDPEDYDAWLSGEQIPLAPYPADRMTARPVSTYVNNVRHEGPQCIEPRTSSSGSR
jgi:putative SOS response-associated peptidase YedK